MRLTQNSRRIHDHLLIINDDPVTAHWSCWVNEDAALTLLTRFSSEVLLLKQNMLSFENVFNHVAGKNSFVSFGSSRLARDRDQKRSRVASCLMTSLRLDD